MSIEATSQHDRSLISIEARLAAVEKALAEHAVTIDRLLGDDRQRTAYLEYETQRARSSRPRMPAVIQQRREP